MHDIQVKASLLSPPEGGEKETQKQLLVQAQHLPALFVPPLFQSRLQAAGRGRLLLQRVAERLQHCLHSGHGRLQSGGACELMLRRARDGSRVTSTL